MKSLRLSVGQNMAVGANISPNIVSGEVNLLNLSDGARLLILLLAPLMVMLIFLASGCSTVKHGNLGALSHLKKGSDLAHAGDFSGAIVEFNFSVRDNNKNAEAYEKRGIAKMELGLFREALVDFNEAGKLHPHDSLVWMLKGRALQATGEYANAIVFFDKCIQLDSSNAGVWNSRGMCNYCLGKFDVAIADYTKSIELDRFLYQALVNRALVYIDCGKWDLAIKDCGKSKLIANRFIECYIACGNAYEGKGLSLLAIEEFTSAIGVDSLCERAYFRRVISYSSIKDDESALADYNSAIRIKADYVDALGHFEESSLAENG